MRLTNERLRSQRLRMLLRRHELLLERQLLLLLLLWRVWWPAVSLSEMCCLRVSVNGKVVIHAWLKPALVHPEILIKKNLIKGTIERINWILQGVTVESTLRHLSRHN